MLRKIVLVLMVLAIGFAIGAYARPSSIHPRQFEPQPPTVARAELEWWIAHRERRPDLPATLAAITDEDWRRIESWLDESWSSLHDAVR